MHLVYVANAVVLYCKSCLVNELDKNSVAVALYRKGISTGNTLPNFFPVPHANAVSWFSVKWNFRCEPLARDKS